jgi:hypothetical protein
MSQFIESFTNSLKPKKNMKFYSHLLKNQWTLYPLPFVYIYFDTCHPESHRTLLDNKICGLYLSFNWLKWTYNVGFHKTLN